MERDELLRLWDEIKQVLRQAQRQIPVTYVIPSFSGSPTRFDDSPEGRLQEYEYMLAQNELELAWDALVVVARETSANAVCWRYLARAAGLMNLSTDENGLLEQVIVEAGRPKS